jgi:hypothetical protein
MSDGGKGSLPREGQNLSEYRKNYDKIFPINHGSVSNSKGVQVLKCSKNCWVQIDDACSVTCNHPNCSGISKYNLNNP